jgi:hypothetical protein
MTKGALLDGDPGGDDPPGLVRAARERMKGEGGRGYGDVFRTNKGRTEVQG